MIILVVDFARIWGCLSRAIGQESGRIIASVFPITQKS